MKNEIEERLMAAASDRDSDSVVAALREFAAAHQRDGRDWATELVRLLVEESLQDQRYIMEHVVIDDGPNGAVVRFRKPAS